MSKRTKITPRFLIDFYDACLRCNTLTKVAATLEMSPQQLMTWVKTFPMLRMANQVASERRDTREDFVQYTLGNLSPEAKKMWKEIKAWKDAHYRSTPTQMATASKRLRQEIFIHALLASSYNISTACRMAGISQQGVQQWLVNDEDFKCFVAEIQLHKKDFFENALMKLVEEGHPGAVMFVNRTINRDRGYTEKLEVSHSGQVGEGIDIDALDLDIDTRRKILEAMRKKANLNQPKEYPVLDAEEVNEERGLAVLEKEWT